MWPPSRVRVLLLLAATVLPGGVARGDEIAAYLERHGLQQLLAVHLEQRLEEVNGQQRDDLVQRLVGIYAQLLESTQEPALRVNLEQRSRRLLAAAPTGAGEELRLALLRGSYRAAETIAESHRLRQSSEKDIDRAKKTLTDIIPKLRQLRGQIEERLQVTERRLMRASGSEAVVLAERAEHSQRLLAQSTFLNAWALYYQSWLNNRPDNARAAEGLFAELLETDSTRPQPQDVSVDLRSVEAVARSILGLALCKSLTSSSATALKWVELLEDPRTYEPLRSQVSAWKMAIHLEHDEFREVTAILTDYADTGQSAPLAWLRLVAVHALEAEHRSQHAAGLARVAVTALAARGELQQVLNLAQRYGVHALGDSGFAFRYIKGVQHYDHAREAHGTERPTTDDQLDGLYQQAVDEFEAALKEPDADRYPSAAASCRWLIGWCHYFQSRFLSARESFELAAQRLGSDDASEALWMAVVSLDKVVQADDNDNLRQELRGLIDRVLALYPTGPHAPKLILKRAISAGEATPQVVQELLAIPAGSEVYRAARRRAAAILYQLFRQASGGQRLAYANEYLAVAGLLVRSAEQLPEPDDGDAIRQYVGRRRRVLEVALSDGIERLKLAADVIAALDESQRTGAIDLSEYQDEIDFRRLQERLFAGDSASAAAIGDRLWGRDQSSVWSLLAQRVLFKYALRRIRAAEDGSIVTRADLDLVVTHGRRVLAALQKDPEAVPDRQSLAYRASIGEALMMLWQRSREREHAAEALQVYEALLDSRPRDAGFLRGTAVLSETLGETDRALECWRMLVAGSSAESQRWYEAKYHLITLLVQRDPDRARDVMDQHKRLNPTYGPEPWGSRLEALDRRIPSAGDREPRSDDQSGSSQPAAGDLEHPS